MKQAVLPTNEEFPMNGNRRSEDINPARASTSNEIGHKNISQQYSPTRYYDSQALVSMSRKTGTARSLMKTTERVLYQKFDVDALRIAARDGDIATASRVLDVKPSSSDAQTLYNAAKGGHDAVINLLFALGDFDPDPEPIKDLPHEFSTPILAAIGKDHHLEVIKLFLGNSRFNPARRIRGETYYEIAKRRGGSKWQEEFILLKNAFEAHQKIKDIQSSKAQVSGAQYDNRLSVSEFNKNLRREDEPNSRSHKYNLDPNLKDREPKRPQHRKHLSLGPTQDGLSMSKKITGKLKNEDDSPGALSEPELSLSGLLKHKSQRSKIDSDSALHSENQLIVKPRRKLLSRKALKDERELERALERLRRERCTSSKSIDIPRGEKERPQSNSKNDQSRDYSASIEVRSPHKYNNSNQNKKDSTFDSCISDKGNHQACIKNDYKDRSVASESPVNRFSNMENMPRQENKENTTYSSSEEKLIKKRKIEGDKYNLSQAINSDKSQGNLTKNAQNSDTREKKFFLTKRSNSPPIFRNNNKENIVTNNLSDDIISKLQDVETFHASLKPIKKDAEALKDSNKRSRSLPKVAMGSKNIREKENIYIGEEKCLAWNSSEKGLRDRTERQQNESIRHVNQIQIQEIEFQKKTHVEQRLLYLEQERLKREEQECRRANMIEQQQLELIRNEKEKNQKRLSKLPLLLKWFDQTVQPKTPDIAKLFSYIVGYRYDSINTEATGKLGEDDPWMLNTHVAILLGEKDLQLSRYTAWERLVLTTPQKRGVWSTFNGIFLLLDGSLSCLRQQLPIDTESMDEVIEKNKKQFLDLDLFLVKVTEFMYIVPNFPHLRGIKMAVLYRELRIPQDADQLDLSGLIPGWNQNLQNRVDHRFVPLPKYYVDGIIVSQTEEAKTRILEKPPPLDIFPRRMGLTRVYPGDSDYEEICKNKKSGKFKNTITS